VRAVFAAWAWRAVTHPTNAQIAISENLAPSGIGGETRRIRMAAANYDESLKRLLVHEGGYSNHPSDPGGPTNFGITIHDYRKYVNPNATAADVRSMPVETAKRIYREKYWNVQRCDELTGGVDCAVFDYGVNSGIGRSGKVLRRLLGLPDNASAVTDDVIAAVRQRDPKVLVAAICDERLAFLRSLGTWPVFGNGWGRRVREVRAAALVMAGDTQDVRPNITASASPAAPPWFKRMTALMGLYEFGGGDDNPAILAMAKACGGKIAREYNHDSIPWCALTVNYCLIASGLAGNGSLWALDFRNYGRSLPGAAVGAIATKTKTRDGGGHVFLVVGRNKDGLIVGRGGNQSDMVCDQLFDPAVLKYNWPSQYPAPEKTGFAALPIVEPAPKTRRSLALPPPTPLVPGLDPGMPGKGVVPAPTGTKKIIQTGVPAGGAGFGATFWDWVAAHPVEAAGVAIVAGAVVIGGSIYLVDRWHKWKQEAPTPDLVPVAA